MQIDTPVEKDAEPEPAVVKKDTAKEEEKVVVEIVEKTKEEKSPKGFFSRIWAWMTSWFS